MSSPCETCHSLCCRYFCFEIDRPDDYEEFENIRWYLYHEGVTVHIDEDGDWCIQIDNPCKELDKNHRCSVYEDRPLICRNYAVDQCEAIDGDFGYRALFKTPDDLVEYAKKTLGEETYYREMIKHRAKAEGVVRSEMRRRLRHAGLLPDGFGKPRRGKRSKRRAADSSWLRG
jgi:Fe-S-cluster containining protein